jgi:prepilin-type N-terminal cleavage/methylation domain-containing protein
MSHVADLPRGSQHGLTLVEILISVAILASASVLILQAFARGAYTLAAADRRFQAHSFAASKMADVELSLQQGLLPTPAGEFQKGRETFRWRVETAPSAEDPDFEHVTLIVEWSQGRQPYETQVSLLRRLPESES